MKKKLSKKILGLEIYNIILIASASISCYFISMLDLDTAAYFYNEKNQLSRSYPSLYYLEKFFLFIPE